MDIVQVISSQSDENHQSFRSDDKETIHTDGQRNKTKNIRKYYEPFSEGGKMYRFEDNPTEYKKMRKKAQNRESAARVRGRKKDSYENLEDEVQYLRKNNLDLQLQNARLDTENKNLKGQVEFMKTLVPVRKTQDPIDCYLSDQVLSHPTASQTGRSPSRSHEEESLMFEEIDWMRGDSQQSGAGWPYLAIFTIILAVFVLPSTAGAGGVAAAFQTGQETSTVIFSQLGLAIDYGKVLIKYLLVLGYAWLVFIKINAYLRSRKLKHVKHV